MKHLKFLETVKVVDGIEVDSLSALHQEIAQKPVGDDEAFYILNVDRLIENYRKWMQLMPRIKPHYAVKCNDNDLVLKTLAHLGTGFDCASKGEIEKVLKIGVSPEKIIYANPAKQLSHLIYASNNDVEKMTFDNAEELFKIKKHSPFAKVVLRIKFDSESAIMQFGLKFGCDHFKEAPYLIKLCKKLNLNLIGVSFHVGSGSNEYSIFSKALQAVRDLFDLAANVGFDLTFVDIGGGFCGDGSTKLKDYALHINKGISELFDDEKYEIISEPGQYFVTSAMTLVCNIHSKRIGYNDDGQVEHINYYMNEGIYLSFVGCHVHETPIFPNFIYKSTRENGSKAIKHASSLWGNSCDACDIVMKDIFMEEAFPGDWVYFQNFGAYTIALSTNFNGYKSTSIKPYISAAHKK